MPSICHGVVSSPESAAAHNASGGFSVLAVGVMGPACGILRGHLLLPVLELATGGQGVGVAGPEHGLEVREQLPVQLQRTRGVPALPDPVGDVVAGGQGVGVAGCSSR
jgi:hypothetical protein